MSNRTHQLFRQNIRRITAYYTFLVQETKNNRMVGSTNEWVLDNYYMISEQEKVLKVELKSIGNGAMKIGRQRVELLRNQIEAYLERNRCCIDKTLMFKYLNQIQVS
ncbi:MAG: hypothetical protein J6X35_10490 [Bacteroidales bacterium]|nr:hypothetical protein [Bacteroidales bacterium]